MKQTLQLKLSQHLTLTPQLQQSIRLLQLSTLELNQELERFLAENPLLEREEGEDDEGFGPPPPATPEPLATAPSAEAEASTPAAEAPPDDEPPPDADADWYLEGGGSGSQRDDSEDGDLPQLAAVTTTLRDHLLHQVSLTKLPPRDRTLVAVLIDALDEDGYLTQPLEEILAMFPEELGIDLEEITIALRHLQNLDPIGVGARSPAECLELQLLAMDEDVPGRACALRVVHDHLELLAARDFTKLKRLIGCDQARSTARFIIQRAAPPPTSPDDTPK